VRNCCHTEVQAEETAEPEKAKPAAPVMFGNGPGRNLVNTIDKGLPATWAVDQGKEMNVLWSAKLGTYSYGGPVVAGGKVFVGTNNKPPRDPNVKGEKGVLVCFDAQTGKFRWQNVHDYVDGIGHGDSGVCSTPAIEGERIYYVSTSCELVCAGVEKGNILWSLDMIKTLNVFPGGTEGSVANSSPLILGDLVYVLTANGVEGGPPMDKPKSPMAPSLVAVDKMTGKLAWSDNSPGENIKDGQWSSPAAAEVNGEWQVIYGGGDGWLYAFEAKKGELRWKFNCNPKGAVFKLGGRGDFGYIIAVPVVYEKHLYVGTGSGPDDGAGVGHLWCIDLEKATAKGKTNPGKDVSAVNNDFDPKSKANENAGFAWHQGGKILPKPPPGQREYAFGRTLSTVAVHDGLVFAPEIAGYLHCFDAKTGKENWIYDLKESTWNSPYVVDGRVMLGLDNADLYIFKADKQLNKPEKIEMGEPLKTPPVVVNGVLYIANGQNLYAIGTKK
jgi:outer membrane protein assembly factor BamB